MKMSCTKSKTHVQFYMEISIKKNSSFFTRKSLLNFFQKSSPKNWTHFQFYKRNPFKNESDQKKGSLKNWNHIQFYKRYPFKKIPFNFTLEIHLIFFRFSAMGWILQKNFLSKFLDEKINPEIRSQKYTLGPMKNIFEKSRPSIQISKIVGETPELVQSFTPIRKLFCTFLY